MPHTSILVQLDPAVRARLTTLAVDRKEPISDLAAEIINLYFAPDTWEPEQIRACLAQLEAVEPVPGERASESLDSWDIEIERRAPK